MWEMCHTVSVDKMIDQQKYNAIRVQMYRVNNKRLKRCTGTSDENHCAPNKTADVSSR